MKAASPFLTAEQAAARAHCLKADGSANLRAFASLRWRLKVQGVKLPTYRRRGSGRPFFKESDIDALFVKDEAAKAVPGALRGLRMVGR